MLRTNADEESGAKRTERREWGEESNPAECAHPSRPLLLPPKHPPSLSRRETLTNGALLAHKRRSPRLQTALPSVHTAAPLFTHVCFPFQRAFVRYYLQNQDIVRVDTEGEVFYTMHAMTGGIVYDYDGFVSRPGGIKEGTKYQRPLVLHGNAVDGKELFAAIMKTIRGENDRLINYKTSEELFSLERNGGDGNVVRHQAMRMMDFMAETGGGLVSESWWAIATVANTLNKHGCYTAAIKLVFAMWRAAVVAGDEDLADIAIKTYASWFMGEGCGFCKVPPLRDSLEAFTLIDVLKSWAIGEDAGGFAYERYNMRALTAKDRSKWEEVSMYNLGIAHWWAGDVQECELAYRRLLAREVPPVAQLQPPQSPPELVDLKIAAVASEDRKELGYLLKTAEYAGMQIDVLGMNDEYGDNAQKMRYFNEYVANLHEDQLVMFVDAYDILVFEGVKELSKKWKEGALCGGEGGFASIVFSAEKSSYPDLGLKGVYGESTSIFTYLNSGAFIGPAGKLRRMLREVSEYPALYISDQRSFVRYYLRNRGEGGDICLDTEGKAFFSLHSVVGECVVRKGGRFENGGSEAAIVHGNAGGEGGKKYYKALFDAVEEVRGEGGKVRAERVWNDRLKTGCAELPVRYTLARCLERPVPRGQNVALATGFDRDNPTRAARSLLEMTGSKRAAQKCKRRPKLALKAPTPCPPFSSAPF